MKTYAEKLRDPRWQKKRIEVFERDGFKCRDCGDEKTELHIHHCFYERGDPWKTDAQFLLTLCKDCHFERQSLEDDCRRAIGKILAGLPNHPGEDDLKFFVTSAVQIACDETASPIVACQLDIDYEADAQWWQCAVSYPKMRLFYEMVTGRKPNWKSAEKL